MKFNYQARDKTGNIQTGQIEASDREAAFDVLKSHGLYVTVLEKLSVPLYAVKLTIFQHANKKDVILFSRQLSIMFKSNVPIVESLKTIAKQTRKQDFREKILKISEKVEGGTSLSEALALFPKLFSLFYVNMTKSGEASGKLADIFIYLSDYLEKESYFQGKIRGAMIYPAFVLAVFFVVVSVLITYVIPQLSGVLKAGGQELPLITKIVIGSSDFVRANALIVIMAIIFMIVAIVFLFKSKRGKKFLGNVFLKTPLVDSFFKKFYLARFALNLSTLISAGLPIIQALDMTSKVISNDNYRKVISKTKEEVRKGETMSSVLGNYPDLISPLFYQMVSVGEKTGRLDSSLKNVVEFYQRDVDQGLNSFISLLEPVFIVLLGGVVGGVMAAVLMPLYSMGAF